MKYFAKYLLIFLLPVLVIIVSMELMLRNMPNRFKLQDTSLLNNGKDIETLILGSSHTQFGINPIYLDTEAFNLSNKSQTLELDFALLQHYQNDLKNLKNIVIRLSYATLFEQLSKSDENWRMKDYELYTKLSFSQDLRHQYEVLSLPFRENLNRIKDFYIEDKDPVQSNNLGWGTETSKMPPSQNIELLGKMVAKKHTISNRRYFEPNKNLLMQLIQWCEHRNISVYLTTLPASKSYFSNLEAEQLNLTISTGNEMAVKFENCIYLNFLSDARFDDSDFFDGDHLNEKGATKFSKLLNTILLQ